MNSIRPKSHEVSNYTRLRLYKNILACLDSHTRKTQNKSKLAWNYDTRMKKKKINTSVKLPRPNSRKNTKNLTFEIQKSKNGKI